MMPAAGSVWRNGDEWRRVVEVNDVSVWYYVFGGYDGVLIDDWHAWAADAVQVWPETPQPVRLSDAEIDRIAERLLKKMFPEPVLVPVEYNDGVVEPTWAIDNAQFEPEATVDTDQ